MKILHLASFNRWSGAAAPAFTEAHALREAGIEAHYGYVGGYLLEEKIGSLPWAHPLLVEGESPISVIRNVRALRRLLATETFDIVHAHLTHDHWLASLAITGHRAIRLVRTFHASRALRTDPLSRRLIARTAALAVVRPGLVRHRAIEGRRVVVTPPPVEARYTPAGPDVRAAYDLAPDTPVIGVIGKVSPGRGFEDAVRTLGLVRAVHPDARMMIIGKGPHRPAIETLVDELGLRQSVIWAGYHEDDLAEHFRTMNVMLFTAAGSDEGHRAITEAGACGVPVAAYPLPGVRFVLGDLAESLVSRSAEPESLVEIVRAILSRRHPGIASGVVENAARFDYRATVDRLMTLYEIARRD